MKAGLGLKEGVAAKMPCVDGSFLVASDHSTAMYAKGIIRFMVKTYKILVGPKYRINLQMV